MWCNPNIFCYQLLFIIIYHCLPLLIIVCVYLSLFVSCASLLNSQQPPPRPLFAIICVYLLCMAHYCHSDCCVSLSQLSRSVYTHTKKNEDTERVKVLPKHTRAFSPTQSTTPTLRRSWILINARNSRSHRLFSLSRRTSQSQTQSALLWSRGLQTYGRKESPSSRWLQRLPRKFHSVARPQRVQKWSCSGSCAPFNSMLLPMAQYKTSSSAVSTMSTSTLRSPMRCGSWPRWCCRQIWQGLGY